MNAIAGTLYVNDKPRPFAAGASLLSVVGELGLADRKGVAIAVNGAVVPRAQWASRAVAEADRVLVIRASQGG